MSSQCFDYGNVEPFFDEIFVIFSSLKKKNPLCDAPTPYSGKKNSGFSEIIFVFTWMC